jgi:hypothetical protein
VDVLGEVRVRRPVMDQTSPSVAPSTVQYFTKRSPVLLPVLARVPPPVPRRRSVLAGPSMPSATLAPARAMVPARPGGSPVSNPRLPALILVPAWL